MNPDERPIWLRIPLDLLGWFVAGLYALLAWARIYNPDDRDEPGGEP